MTSEALRERIAELTQLESDLYAKMNQVIGMRLAFDEVLQDMVSEPEEGA